MIFPFSLFKVSGHSMEPVLKPGSYVFTYNWANPKIGDVVVFMHNGKYMVKRVCKIENGKYHVLGDNKDDSLRVEALSRRQIVGKSIFCRRSTI
jgi:phage repressor protein C with HTH and peptisase S24 domain